MQILAAFAEYFRSQLAEKVKGGMRERAKQGKPMGRRPYGYRIDTGEFIIDETEAQIILHIYDSFVNKNKGLRVIAEELNMRFSYTASGNPWTHLAVRDVLKNEVYTGVYKWGAIRLQDTVPPIIPRDLFERTQIRRKKNGLLAAELKMQHTFLAVWSGVAAAEVLLLEHGARVGIKHQMVVCMCTQVEFIAAKHTFHQAGKFAIAKSTRQR